MEPYVGEITLFAGNFAPQGWAFCDGTELSISEYETLFSVIGNRYGGDGQTTFRLPDLRGRIPIHFSDTHPLGQMGGTETVTLLSNQMPVHTHVVVAQTATGTQTSPANAVWATSTTSTYAEANANQAMSPNAIMATGGSQPHDNMMPFLAVNFIIALYGLYPSQN